MAPTPPPFWREVRAQAVAGTVVILVASIFGGMVYLVHTVPRQLDEVGIIVRGGAWDPETGEQLEPPVVLDGWHVNYQGDLPEGWEEFLVEPQNPVRVWA